MREPHSPRLKTRLGFCRYSWRAVTAASLERRDEYMAGLEAASVDQDIRPFASFLCDVVARPDERRRT